MEDQKEKFMDTGFRGFLQKPFGMKDLSVKIKEVLA